MTILEGPNGRGIGNVLRTWVPEYNLLTALLFLFLISFFLVVQFIVLRMVPRLWMVCFYLLMLCHVAILP